MGAYATKRSPGRDLRLLLRGNAVQALDGLEVGVDIIGLTKGQFSMIDLVDAGLRLTGPASLMVATWTAGLAEIRKIHRWVEAGRVTAMRWLIDRSFITRHPSYARELRELFGDDPIRATNNHSKFAVIRGGGRHLAIRSTMNLNRNSRLENFEASDDAVLADFFETVVSEVFEDQELGDWADGKRGVVSQGFEAIGAVSRPAIDDAVFGVCLSDPLQPGFKVFP